MTNHEKWSPSKRTIVGKNVKIAGGDAEVAMNCRPLPRFVVLRHEMPAQSKEGSHWDFMLECGKSLLTFRWDYLPMDEDDQCPFLLRATRIADHRPLYLDYEGEISNNRGRVKRILSGHFLSVSVSPLSVQEDLMNCRLDFWPEERRRQTHPPSFQLWIPNCKIDQECAMQVLRWRTGGYFREASS